MLQRDYRRAWETLTLEVEGLQREAKSDVNSAAFEGARLRVEAASNVYRVARNELAQALLGDLDKERAAKAEHEAALATCAAR